MSKLIKYSIIGIIFVSILGTLSHFTYDWFQQNNLIGLFVPINESVWEHMKLVFFPLLIYSIIMNKKLMYEYPGLKSALYFGIIIGTLFIPIVYYTYVGIIGYHHLILDILTFIFIIIIAFFSIYRLTRSKKLQNHTRILKILVSLLFIGFIFFTYFPPKLALFKS